MYTLGASRRPPKLYPAVVPVISGWCLVVP